MEFTSLLEAAIPRFISKMDICECTGCWIWKGARSKGGQRKNFTGRATVHYGSFYVFPGRIVRAHIYSAALFGLIPSLRVGNGWTLDHICENGLCVNPFHLELVTQAENDERKRKPRGRLTWAERFTYRGIGSAQ